MQSASWSRAVVWVSAVLTASLISCVGITDTCACTPVPPLVATVSGTVVDANDQPVPGVGLSIFGAVPGSPPIQIPDGWTLFADTTAADGSFLVEAGSMAQQQATLELRVVLRRPGATANLEIKAGTATFRVMHEPKIDTARVTVRLPQ